MANTFLLKAESREDIGKGASRRLRREHKIPAVIYGGEDAPQSITLSHFEVLKCLNDDAFYSQIIDIEVAGEVQETILRDLQRHPYKPTILHVDFQRVVRGQELTFSMPLNYLGAEEAVGVKAGGILSQNVIDVEITCRPRDIPQVLEVDVSALDINDTISMSEINLPEGVRLTAFEALEGEELEQADQVIVSVLPPKLEEVEEEASVDADGTATESSADTPAEGDAE